VTGAILNVVAVFLWWRTDASRPIVPTGMDEPLVAVPQ
jgi:hypothetical protein